MFLYVYFPFYTLSTFEHITEQTLKKIYQSSYTQCTNIYVLVLILNGFFRLCFSTFFFIFFFFCFFHFLMLYSSIIHLRKYWFFIYIQHLTETQKGASKSAYIRMLVAGLILLLHFQLFTSFMAIRLHSYDSISIHSDAKDER